MQRYTKSKSDSGKTPEWIKEYIRTTWGDFLELCPYNPNFDEVENATTNALVIDWENPSFCNPPYSNWKPFVKHGFDLWKTKQIVSIFLLKTDHLVSPLFTEIAQYCEIRIFNKRLKFGGYKRQAPFVSCLVIFDGKNTGSFSMIQHPSRR